jgi:hypothetical protein
MTVGSLCRVLCCADICPCPGSIGDTTDLYEHLMSLPGTLPAYNPMVFPSPQNPVRFVPLLTDPERGRRTPLEKLRWLTPNGSQRICSPLANRCYT